MVVISVIAITLGLLAVKYYKKDDWDNDRSFLLTLAASVIAVLTIFGSTVSYGFDMKYAYVYQGTGTVQEITNVMTNGSGVTTTKPLVKFEESEELFSFSDSRVSTYTGYELDILCKLSKGWLSMDAYRCTVLNINDRGEK